MNTIKRLVLPAYVIVSSIIMLLQLTDSAQQLREIDQLHKDQITKLKMLFEWKDVNDRTRKIAAEFGYEVALAGWSKERMLHHIDELHARAQVTVIQNNYFESIE